MKRYCLLFTLLITTILGNAQIVNIPDTNFKDALLNHNPPIDTNDDGEIQISEAEVVIGLDLNWQSIYSLDGIQNFINIEVLECDNNELTSIDLSQNINLEIIKCRFNQISSLEVLNNPKLKKLECGYNELTNLDITQNPLLEWVVCAENQIENLNISQNPNLYWLSCHSNELVSLDISQNPNLEILACHDNNIEALDTTNNIILKELYCSNNQISELDVSLNPNLEALNCRFNNINNIDVSFNTILVYFKCDNNQLINLNAKNGNNIIMYAFDSYNNPNLNCIQVDDIDFANIAEGWNKDETAIYSEVCKLATEDNTLLKIALYPNPAEDILYLFNESTAEVTSIKVYDSLGKLVLEQDNPSTQIDITSLSPGLFFAHIENGNDSLVKKVIKE